MMEKPKLEKHVEPIELPKKSQEEMEKEKKELFEYWDKNFSEGMRNGMLRLLHYNRNEAFEMGDLPDWDDEDLDYFIDVFLKEDIIKALEEETNKLRKDTKTGIHEKIFEAGAELEDVMDFVHDNIGFNGDDKVKKRVKIIVE